MSDIFGKAVQFWAKPTDINWLLSNDMNWAIRNMANPKQYGQPNCYQGVNWYTGTADNGGVHTNSGVGNFFYYLLVNGGAATNDKGNAYTVTGLGLTVANAIIYRSETTYLTPTSNYAAWRTACINAATDLYGAGSTQVAQVQNAWYAVGVGTAAGGGGGTTCSAPTGLTSVSITNTTATISWGNTGAVSYNLQWKASSAASWTTVSGLTTTSYALSGLVTCTGYQFQVQGVCSTGTSAYSTAASFSTTGCTTTYCTSKGNNSTYEYINRIALGTINNTSGNNAGYGNYTALSTNLAGSTAATITMVPGFASTTYREYWTVYIDYNKNGVFTDAGEKVATGNGTGTVTATFTVPASALNGATRMRVQMKYASAATNSCTTFTYGEVEDYTVNITGNAAFTINGTSNAEISSDVLYPNPVNDRLHLSFNSSSEGKVVVSVYNVTGQWMKSAEYRMTEGSNDFDMSTVEFPAGLYLLKVSGDVNQTYRFMIAK
ncbi:MAG: M4 family metallopeptidase [Bacteroidetes bacterium]|nr:M4 family metallopeptidase [Bacteroidota bacterium]